MLYHQSTPDQMFLSAAVRNQWVAFENWLVAPRGATEQRRTELLTTLQEDFLKNLRSTADTFHPMLQQDYENNKMRLNLHLDEELVLLAQLEWDRRLSKAGLKPEDWIDMTPAERHSVERLLGGAIEDEQFAVVDSDPGALPSTSTLQTPITHPVPTPNGSPYTFVNPRAFGGEEEDVAEDDTDEDDPSLDNFIFPVDAWTRDETSDRLTTAAFTRWAAGRASPDLFPDLAQRDTARAPPTNVPPTHVPAPAHGATRKPAIAQPMSHPQLPNPTVPTTSIQGLRAQAQVTPHTVFSQTAAMSQAAASEAIPDPRSNKPRVPAPRYVGPILHDPHDAKTEEADFESYKVDTRVKKIWEFHFEAAALDAQLARTLCDRRLDKAEVRRHIEEHERSVERLRLTKEDERKTIVELERSKRVAEINRRDALLSASPDQRQIWEAMLGSLDPRGGQKPSHDAERKSTVETTASMDLLASLPVQNEKARVSMEREERRHGQNSESQAPGTSKTMLDPPSKSRSQRTQEAQPQKVTPKTHQKQPSRSSEKHKDPFASFPPTPNLSASEWKPESREAANPSVRQSEALRKGGDSMASAFGDSQGGLWASSGGEARRPTQPAAAVASTSKTTLDPTPSSSSHRAQEIWTPAAASSTSTKHSGNKSTNVAGSAQKVPPSQNQMDWTAIDWLNMGREVESVEAKQGRGAKAKISTIQLPPVSPTSDAPGVVAGRLRRASDPPSPSPKFFAVHKQKSGPAAMETTVRPKPAGILKKQGGPARARKSVTVEEVSDEDAPWEVGEQGTKKQAKRSAGDHPADANTIIEPKPSIPTASFAQIFQYGADGTASPAAGSSNVRKMKSEPPPPADDKDQQDSPSDSGSRSDRDVLPSSLEETIKAKHVRWTPSIVNESPSSSPVSLGDEQDILSAFGGFAWSSSTGESPALPQASTSAHTVQSRSRPSGLVQPVEAPPAPVPARSPPAPVPAEIWQPPKQKQKQNEKKGKGKGKGKAKVAGAGAGLGVGGQQASEGSTDDLEWFAREAIESLKQQRSKPASAV